MQREHVTVVLGLHPLKQGLDLRAADVEQGRRSQDAVLGGLGFPDPADGDAAEERDLDAGAGAPRQYRAFVRAFLQGLLFPEEGERGLELAVVEGIVGEKVEVDRSAMREPQRERRAAVEHVAPRHRPQRRPERALGEGQHVEPRREGHGGRGRLGSGGAGRPNRTRCQ